MAYTRHIIVTDSEQIEMILYNPQERKMMVHFKNGAKYIYESVPDYIIGELITAESVGKTFHALKGRFKKYERIA